MSSLQALRQMNDREIVGAIQGGKQTADPYQLAKRKLLYDLLQIGVRPLRDEDVNRYQEKAERRLEFFGDIGRFFTTPRQKFFGEDLKNREDKIELVVRYVIGALVFSIWLAVAYLSVSPLAAGLMGFLGLALGVGFTFAGELVGILLMSRYYGSQWETASYAEFTGALKRTVPEPVAELAQRIRGLRPDAEIKVEYLKLDPFLTVHHPEYQTIRFRVAVWDERSFRTTDS